MRVDGRKIYAIEYQQVISSFLALIFALMRLRCALCLPLAFYLLCSACSSSSSPYVEQNDHRVIPKLELVARHLTAPVAMEVPKDGSGRIFICEQTGRIRVISNNAPEEKPFLDLQARIASISTGYSEKGLLGMCFHPDFKKNGRFFVYYSVASHDKKFNHISRISEFHAEPGSSLADSTSEKIILEIGEPESNHNGGQLAFGPDGYLYIGVGDGGGAGDEHGDKGNGQNLTTLLGKILRIDVDIRSPYGMPPGNPFEESKIKPQEIWAYGLRNPWRFSFDTKTGRLFCADVGQDNYEEIDLIEKGKNYGWRKMEGLHCYDPKDNCDTAGLTLPIAEYSHSKGICVIGGYVYHGSSLPFLEGKYVFADWQGHIFYLEEKEKKWSLHDLFLEGKNENQLGLNINSLGQDEKGEVYFLTQESTGPEQTSGALYKLSAQ
jgi:glucose/arabinose dehydrogenase